MSEMIDRVAKAIYPALLYGSDYDEVPYEQAMTRPRYLHLKARVEKDARAAIEAMRGQCSEAMIRAFWDGGDSWRAQSDGYPDDSRSSEWYGDADDFRKGFDAMIDVALKSPS